MFYIVTFCLLFSFKNYDSFIEKTKAELNKELDTTPDSKLVLEQSSIKSPHRYTTKIITIHNVVPGNT